MFYWIYNVPSLVLVVLFSVTFVGFAWLGIILTRKRVRRWVEAESDWNEIMGLVLSSYGVFYGIVLGLIAVGTYQNFEEVDQAVEREAATLGTLYTDVSYYPEPLRDDLQGMLREYCRYIIEEAWPAQQRGVVAYGATDRVTAFEQKLLAFEPKTPGEEILHAETVQELNAFVEARRQRAYGVEKGLPVELWYVVIIGAVLSIVLTWLFALERLGIHLILSGILAMFIGVTVFLIAAMDNPFRGTLSISPEAFEIVLKTVMNPSS